MCSMHACKIGPMIDCMHGHICFSRYIGIYYIVHDDVYTHMYKYVIPCRHYNVYYMCVCVCVCVCVCGS